MLRITLILCLCTVALSKNFALQKEPMIIPKPNKIELANGYFFVTDQTPIYANNQAKEIASYLQNALMKDAELSLRLTNSKKQKGILLMIDAKANNAIGSYQLHIEKRKITITASSVTGLFYGVQSLRQMILFSPKSKKGVSLPQLHIEDQPRFQWRAFMLDESRHFKGMAQVKKLLDEMALLKMNIFHWHLTDDQGWRIEIKKYPLLTEIGSKRSNTQIGGWNSEERSDETHEGFYTQEQIREIVAYAAERHITIVPEIEMPGHASAAIAAYPWLGTSARQIAVPVVFGKMPDSYNVANERVYEFLQDVLAEVMALFPSEIIHIGGDEVKYDQWKESATVQSFMKLNHLNSAADLQIYFTNKISRYLDAKGKRMMGWNEIMGHNVHNYQKSEDMEIKEQLAVRSVIHFWKGDLKLAKAALKRGYDIVNSLHSKTYLDYSYKQISLQSAYDFDPIPEGLEAKYHKQVLGTGAQMWGEWVPTIERMDYQVFPRLAAYAEVGWTNLEQKDYNHFSQVMIGLKDYWQKKGIGFAVVD